MSNINKNELLTWIELSKAAYKHNLRFFEELLSPASQLTPVVKANAYGHGLSEIVGMAAEAGINSFAVHALEEAVQVKWTAPEAKVLIMGPIISSALDLAVENNFRVAVFNRETLAGVMESAAKSSSRVYIHLKIETGTNRLGIREDELPEYLSVLKGQNLVVLEGIYTHFANIEDTTDHSFAKAQLENFNSVKTSVKEAGFPEIITHTACSAAMLLFPETHMELARLGISQYGLWSSRETFVSYKAEHKVNGYEVLKPVLAWKTRIGQLKKVPEGEFIGYGCTYKTTRDSLIAVLPVGYADGVDRKLSNKGYVLIKGQRAPIRGRVCMNLTMVDVTDIKDLKVEDEVTLIGHDGDDYLPVEKWAAWADTINYEMVTKIRASIPRIIV